MAATLIFISGRGLAISSAKEGKAYHQLSANEFFSMSSIERKTYSSIERRFSVHSPIYLF